MTVEIDKKNVAETNSFSNTVFVNVVEPLFLATSFFGNVVTPMVLSTFSKAKTTTKTTGNASTKQLLTDLTVDISKNYMAATNGFSNIVSVNVVEPLVSATVSSNML